MEVRVYIPGALRAFSEGAGEVRVVAEEATARGALTALARRWPGVAARVLDERGKVRPHVNVFVGRENVRDLAGLETTLAEGSEIFILPSVTGGCQQPECVCRQDLPRPRP